MITRTVLCPNCNTEVSCQGNPGDRVQVVCPNCSEKGMVVFPAEKLMEKAMELAQKIASRAPLAVRYAKEAVNRSQEGDTASGFALASYLHALSCTTEDKKEGLSAFLEKRKGKFKGK